MRMLLAVILTARTAEKMSNFLSIFRLSHDDVSPEATVADWRDAGQYAEAAAPSDASAGCYGGSEHIGVLPVVVPEHKLVQVEREVDGGSCPCRQ